MIIFVYLLIALTVAIIPSHFISLALYRKLAGSGNRYAVLTRVLAFLFSFCLIIFLLYLLVIYNVRFER